MIVVGGGGSGVGGVRIGRRKGMVWRGGGWIGKNEEKVVMVEAVKEINVEVGEGDGVGLVGEKGGGKGGGSRG